LNPKNVNFLKIFFSLDSGSKSWTPDFLFKIRQIKVFCNLKSGNDSFERKSILNLTEEEVANKKIKFSAKQREIHTDF